MTILYIATNKANDIFTPSLIPACFLYIRTYSVYMNDCRLETGFRVRHQPKNQINSIEKIPFIAYKFDFDTLIIYYLVPRITDC